MSKISKYHNHTLQTNSQRKSHITQSHKKSGRQLQLQQSNQLSLPRQEDCKTRKDTEPPQTMGE